MFVKFAILYVKKRASRGDLRYLAITVGKALWQAFCCGAGIQSSLGSFGRTCRTHEAMLLHIIWVGISSATRAMAQGPLLSARPSIIHIRPHSFGKQEPILAGDSLGCLESRLEGML
jgi:hypothetical protein